jgi:tetratricopeptide (TPR) repeat protein
MKRVIAVTLLIGTSAAFGAGSGPMDGGGGMGDVSSVRRTPQQLEARSYNAGLNHKKRAVQYEQKAAKAKSDADRDKLLAKARSQYQDSIEDFKKAIGYNNRSYQAFNELGYALRKTGDYDTAVKAYDAALSLKADYAPAIEYRGEAYLALGQLDAVKEAYLNLFRDDQDQAATLLQAMEAWSTANGDGSPDTKAFADWVAERKRVAGQTQSLSMNNARDWD